RVFKWRDCNSGTPRLDDWTITYQTDKNPAWGFEVELEDICATSLDNQAEITTSTPEVTLTNNTSRASMSVNSADLRASLDLEESVVAPFDPIAGIIRVENLGPGDAREVEVSAALPEGCADFEFEVLSDTEPSGGAFDPLRNVVDFSFDALAAGEVFEVWV